MLISLSLCTDMMSPAIHTGIDLQSAKIKMSLFIAFIDSWIRLPKSNSELNFLSSELCLILDKHLKARIFLTIEPKPAYLWFLEIILNSWNKWFEIHLVFTAWTDLYQRVCHYSAIYSISVYSLSNIQIKLSWVHWKISQAFDKLDPVGISVKSFE